ncbi:hypothetical protein AK812_SmicGene18366 [Symbiodinium microadriaticum]|uniref:Uncharacterized protein n=1 Tax=Symbiodinium microadriaticum TaxID=2951 RepID=A0A1Q9DVC5_SYMMI|nr:hypothetical protein AK812_SmicGene18366 [Symbiodinium microadriaticum]
MGTAPGIWNTILVGLVSLVPRDLWQERWFSEGLAWFSLPMVWFTDQFVKETHAMRVEVTTSDGRRCVAVQTHESFRRCVAQSSAEFLLHLLERQTSTGASGLSWRPGDVLQASEDMGMGWGSRPKNGRSNWMLARNPGQLRPTFMPLFSEKKTKLAKQEAKLQKCKAKFDEEQEQLEFDRILAVETQRVSAGAAGRGRGYALRPLSEAVSDRGDGVLRRPSVFMKAKRLAALFMEVLRERAYLGLTWALRLLRDVPGVVGHRPQGYALRPLSEALAPGCADAKKVMKIQGEDVSPLQWAQKYGDPMTADRLRKAISRAAEEPPLIILPDVDARVESTTKKLPVAILFPGQGSQYVKMLAEVGDVHRVSDFGRRLGQIKCPVKKLYLFVGAFLSYGMCRTEGREGRQSTNHAIAANSGRGYRQHGRGVGQKGGRAARVPTMPLPLTAAAVTDSMGEVPQSKLQEFAWRHQKLHDQIRLVSQVSEALLQDFRGGKLQEFAWRHQKLHDQIRLVSQVSEALLQDMILAQDEPLTLSPKGGRSIDSFDSAPAGHATGHTPSIPSVERIQSDFLQSQMSWAGAQTSSMKRKQTQSSKSLNSVPAQDPGSHAAHLLDLDAADSAKREVDDDVGRSIANVVDAQVLNESPGAVVSKHKEDSMAPVVVMSSLVPVAPSPPAPSPPMPSLAPAPSQDLPGVLEAPEEQNGAMVCTYGAENVSFVNIASMAQTTILDNWNSSRPKQRSDSDIGEDKRFNGDCWDSWDVGSRVLLKFPIFLYAVLGLFTIAEVGMVLYLKYEGHARTTSRANTLACAVIYLLASSSSGVLLSMAIKSEEFRLALGNLSSFLADFQLNFSHAAGMAWRKYFTLWLGFVVLVVFTQVWEMQRTFTDLDPAARDSTEVQIIILVACALGCVNLCACCSLIVIVAATLSHFLRGLDKCLDCWCYDISQHGDFSFGVQSWNRMQALLKCVGRHLASSFVSMQAIAFLGFVYTLGSIAAMVLMQSDTVVTHLIFDGLSSLPLLLLFMVCMAVSANGAALTEKCRIIPSLVNQMPSEEPVEHDRQYLVQFISDSAAGFIVKDVPLTREMFAKQFILIAGLTSGTEQKKLEAVRFVRSTVAAVFVTKSDLPIILVGPFQLLRHQRKHAKYVYQPRRLHCCSLFRQFQDVDVDVDNVSILDMCWVRPSGRALSRVVPKF